jgi:molecular chaperone GrpE
LHGESIYAQDDEEAMSDTESTKVEATDADAAIPPTQSQANESRADESQADAVADTQPEPDAPPPEPTLEDQLAAARDEIKATREKMLRVAADFENFRKRASREADDARDRGVQSAVKDLLPVFDNIDRATSHVDDQTDVKSMADGLRMVNKQFLDVLARLGIARVAGVGSPFDPAVHESIQYDNSDEHAAGLVMNVLQPGYARGDQLIRPALVVVSRGPKEPPTEAAPAEEPPSAPDGSEG